MAIRPCPACGEAKTKEQGKANGFGLVVCKNCMTLFTKELPVDEERQDYDEYYSESNLRSPSFIKMRLSEIISGFSEYSKNGNLLDIGFGAGAILEVAQSEGWKPLGVEVSKPAVEQAKKKGFDVFHGELAEAGYPDDCFDVVTASEILEHLSNPQDLLNEVIRILRPGGLFWATTPSSRGISYRQMGIDWSVVYPPEHIQLFSKKGISGMLVEAGFSEFDIHTYAVNPFEILSYYFPKDKDPEKFDRVRTGYELNESFSKNQSRQTLKRVLNWSLNLMRIGDSLKIFARK